MISGWFWGLVAVRKLGTIPRKIMEHHGKSMKITFVFRDVRLFPRVEGDFEGQPFLNQLNPVFGPNMTQLYWRKTSSLPQVSFSQCLPPGARSWLPLAWLIWKVKVFGSPLQPGVLDDSWWCPKIFADVWIFLMMSEDFCWCLKILKTHIKPVKWTHRLFPQGFPRRRLNMVWNWLGENFPSPVHTINGGSLINGTADHRDTHTYTQKYFIAYWCILAYLCDMMLYHVTLW